MNHHFQVVLAPALLASLALVASAQTVTVTTLNDVTDFGLPQRVENLPGPDGRVSFQEACIAANNTPGPQTIEFAVPQSEFWLVMNMALLKLENGPFVLRDDATTIDFSSQTANIGDTNPAGPDIGIYGLEPNGWGSPAIIITASNSVIRGLGAVWQRGASVAIWQGNDNHIVGCQTGMIDISGSFGGPSVQGNIVGGTTPEDRNVIDNVVISCWADNNLVIGNSLRHVSIGGSQYCVYPTGNRVGGPTPEERNVIAGNGRYGEEGFPSGSQVDVLWARDTIIEGNFIGTTPDGMAARQPQIGPTGVAVNDSINTTVRGNLIAGLRTVGTNHYNGQLFGEAILVGAINADNQTTIIENNLIGVAADGVTAIPTLRGIVVAPATSLRQIHDTRIGGPLPAQGNRIVSVQQQGVLVSSLISGVAIRGNSIHDNGGLGIDLFGPSGGAGVTPNDPGDADSGGNGLQNFPVLTSAVAGDTGVLVTGSLVSSPLTTFRIEFFASRACDPGGYGEGDRFLGGFEVVTDAGGAAAFVASLAAPAEPGEFVTATATRTATGDTSEFSACIAATGPTCLADFNADGTVTSQDFFDFLAAFFAGNADFNHDGSTNSQDFFDFLAVFFAGCP